MQECVARTACQLDKAKALIRVVPFDGRSDGQAGGAVKLRTTRWRISEITGSGLVVIVGEITPAGRAKISVSVAHVRVLLGGGLVLSGLAENISVPLMGHYHLPNDDSSAVQPPFALAMILR
jgi:hypothetical protein